MTKHVKWTEEFRLDRNSIPEPNSGCWLWTASRDKRGYGRFDPTRMAHRVSYQVRVGAIPEGLFVCHKCDTPACVNPDHLFVGTHADNVADKVRKGRTCCGESRPFRKLNESQVREIKKSQGPAHQVAAKYGVSRTVVQGIRRGTRWKHVL